ncbi:MAG: RnfABCDGE type electron transport complex subunit B, partial [Candidatus Macondimonas sp.]
MDWTAMAVLLVPIAGFGVVLSRMAARWPDNHSVLVEQLQSALPQTQCGQCDYAGCRPYAQALAAGEAPPNRCVPGGTKTRDRLLLLLGLDAHAADF